LQNILVAIDDIEATTISSPIVERTLELAQALSSNVWVLHVIPRLGEPPFNVDGKTLRHEVDIERRREYKYLQKLVQSLCERSINATALLLEGKVITTILEESERLDIDLIVLGCHRHSLLYGALMDMTDDGLLSKCCRPIMIVPIPA
jgi:nucleotide-binding universal stress UspA family protein